MPSPAPTTLADLVAPVSSSQAMQNLLDLAESVGLQSTQWQPLGISRTILETMAVVISNYSKIVNFIAQGGYASYAALMVDSSGTPVTTWMDLIVKNTLNLDRIPAIAASGPVSIVNNTGTSYAFSAGQFHLSNPVTGATYSNVNSITIAPTATTIIQIQADTPGLAGSSGAGVTLSLATPIVGVSVSPLATALVGSDAETNAALLARYQAKPAAFSPNGPAGAYTYVATTTVPPSGVPVTRVRVTQSTSTGRVTVYGANPGGAPLPGDVTAINLAIQASVVPNAVTASFVGASNLTVPVIADIWAPAISGVSSLAIQDAASTSIGVLLSTFPIGGIVDSIMGPSVLPRELIVATIYDAVVALMPSLRSQVTVSVSTPSSDVVMTIDQVAVSSTTTIGVHLV